MPEPAGTLGSLGEITFGVSSSFVRTFSELNQQGSGRWAEHAIIAQKPKLEFLGPGLEEISFKMHLDTALGLDPDAELKKLQEARDTGAVLLLIFGETKIGYFALTGLSTNEGPRSNKGLPTWIDASVTLKEYAYEPEGAEGTDNDS